MIWDRASALISDGRASSHSRAVTELRRVSLASTSIQQGRVASAHALEVPTLPESPWFPYGIYSVPEISTVGMSEEEVQARGIPYEVGIARLRGMDDGVTVTSQAIVLAR